MYFDCEMHLLRLGKLFEPRQDLGSGLSCPTCGEETDDLSDEAIGKLDVIVE
jgi:hypothetical protein